MIYLDGNSLGPCPLRSPIASAHDIGEWGKHSSRLERRRRMTHAAGRRPHRPVVGAPTDGGGGRYAVHQGLPGAGLGARAQSVAARDLVGHRKLCSDLYIASGLLESLDRGYALKVVAPEDVEAAIDETIAVLMLTEVDYRTGRLHDMRALTRRALAAGALTVWDLAHAAGASPVELEATEADFAVGCTYKYLNAGPGAPAFIYVAPKHADTARPALSGWMGHHAPFAFDLDYRAGPGIERAGRYSAVSRGRARRRPRRLDTSA